MPFYNEEGVGSNYAKEIIKSQNKKIFYLLFINLLLYIR